MTLESYPWPDEWTVTMGGESRQIDTPSSSAMMNLLGSEGWELVGPPVVTKYRGYLTAFHDAKMVLSGTIDLGDPFAVMYYFKREVEG